MDISPPETPSQIKPKSGPPRFFGLVAWSWIIMAGLSLALGLLSVPSFFQLDQMRLIFERPPYIAIPEIKVMIEKLLDYYVPFSIMQIVVSALSLWFGILFLKRKNLGRLGLSAINIFTGIFGVVGTHATITGFQKLFDSIGGPALVKAGLVQDIPFIMSIGLWSSLALMLGPLIWMAWFFHSQKVRDYCS